MTTDLPFPPGGIGDLAARLAEEHTVAAGLRPDPRLFSRLRKCAHFLQQVYDRWARTPNEQQPPHYATEWFLDNNYIVQQAFQQVYENLPPGYYRALPVLEKAQGWANLPRIYIIAQEITRYCEAHLDPELIVRFVQTYQRGTPLTTGELWALPAMLRLTVLEYLTDAIAQVAGQPSPLEAGGPPLLPLPGAADDGLVANCILGLRTLAIQDWKDFFEKVSPVEAILRRDPSGVYAAMTFETRDRYRAEVEKLARATGLSEEAVAQGVIRLAEAHFSPRQTSEAPPHTGVFLGDEVPREAHVGYYLLDAGRELLEARLDHRPSWRIRLGRWISAHATPIYLGSIFFLTVLLMSGLLAYAIRAGGSVLQAIALGFLLLLPASTVAVSTVNRFITHTIPPRILPKMDFQKSVPDTCRTMVVIPALLGDMADVEALLQQIELHFLGNDDPNISFALLTDFTDAPQAHMPEDDTLLAQVTAGIQALNRKYARRADGPFYLFHRERKWNPAEECWMGWERKRGKLMEFNHLLAGRPTSYVIQIGDLDRLSTIRYVITLDADTLLPQDGARRLIATLAHPLNRPRFDPRTDRVIAGYTILQPRVEIKPTVTARSRFTQIFGSDTGLDLYTRAVSDVYQDFFGAGLYTGKGIYDVAAFERSLAGRVPENRLLSHDLFEGIHGRVGLVTDIILYEDYPTTYLAYVRRLHRWVRGDWQLLPWLFPRVPAADGGRLPNPLSAIDRWKIIDNMRRSLLAPALLAFLAVGWIWLPGSALLWTSVAMIAMAALAFAGVLTAWLRRLRGQFMLWITRTWWTATFRWLLAMAFLPYEALVMVDAIAATCVRMFITHKRLLQWTTASHTIRLFGKQTRLGLLWRQMGSASILSLALTWIVWYFNPPALLVATPFLLMWIFSPYIAYWISQPTTHAAPPLSPTQRRQVRLLARRTWLYCEQFVGPEEHWLPPDHFQEDPKGQPAHRTSPTNIGLLLLSTLTAYDLGYIGPLELTLRLRPTFETMSRLAWYRGHFLNWYDTRTLQPLSPWYVSAVDSGNLAACLLTLRQGLMAIPQEPLLRSERWQGLMDTLDVLEEVIVDIEEVIRGAEPDTSIAPIETLRDLLDAVRDQVHTGQNTPLTWPDLLHRLRDETWPRLEQHLIAVVEAYADRLDVNLLQDMRTWADRVQANLRAMQHESHMLFPWLTSLAHPPALFTDPPATIPVTSVWQKAWPALSEALLDGLTMEHLSTACKAAQTHLLRLRNSLAEMEREMERETDTYTSAASAPPAEALSDAYHWCTRLGEELDAARMTVEALLISYRDLSQEAERLFQAMDFRFLFNAHRQVFHIGYNVESEALDDNCYDLLASEARIASLLAIAKRNVPLTHWLHLARPLTQIDGTRALLSWGGTMFEYLMPALLMKSPPNTLLEQSCRAAIHHQIRYARRRRVPWGISESGYYRFDAAQNYQYRGFGVPGLGLKRGLEEDLVIAPYASLMALPIRPQAVMENISHLQQLNMLGRYGFYEALDYTDRRLPAGQRYAIVRSYMVHHHGMALLAMDNVLCQNKMIARFHADLRVRSVELLLHEQVPHQVPVSPLRPEAVQAPRSVQPPPSLAPWSIPPTATTPQMHILSNGRYALFITHTGGGYSQWGDIALTRWRADTTRDDHGLWVYISEADAPDEDEPALWSATLQPTGIPPDNHEILFHAHQVEFRRRDGEISVHLRVAVAADDDAEVRQVTLINHSDRPRRLKITSYGEVVLAPQSADRRHPAFNKLFIESEYHPEIHGLLFRRRPRSSQETPVYLVHQLVMESTESLESNPDVGPTWESDRACFLGRGGDSRRPAALTAAHSEGLSGSTGATLDPVMALQQVVTLPPHSTVRLAFVTLAASSYAHALALAHRYQSWPRICRAFDRAYAHSVVELQRLQLTTEQLQPIQALLSALWYPQAVWRAEAETLSANQLGQSGLWPFAISGDYPILLLHIHGEDGIRLVQQALQAHTWWRNRGAKVDLVILNERESSYHQEVQGRLLQQIEQAGSDGWLNQRGGIFVLRADQMRAAERTLLETAARVILDDQAGSLSEQTHARPAPSVQLPRFVPTRLSPSTGQDERQEEEETPALERPAHLLFDNGWGGFHPDGREYVIYLRPGEWPPAPWINVLANPDFGCLISEAGSGYTWAGNSGENRLTPWRNDPVSDPPSEAIYLRDEESGVVWSPTRLPMGASAPHLIRHGAGYTAFEHHSHGIVQRLSIWVPPDAPIKIARLRLENTTARNRRITATCYVEWQLGPDREIHQQHIIPEFDAVDNALLARNPYNVEFGTRIAFLTATKEPYGLTGDRTEFLGWMGSTRRPAALERVGLTGTIAPGLDPCAVYQVHLWLAPGENEEVCFLLGQGMDREHTHRLIQAYRRDEQIEASWQATNEYWDHLLSAVTVQTPDPMMDLMLNRWLLYQALACRLWGRSALYQSSGAYGYRDQLQDVMALIHAAPELVREHILRAAGHQFTEGDVLHWWHPPSGRGVRTRCSDDLLWLPYVTAHYVETTGDGTILDEMAPFLLGDPLEPEEHERYSLYEAGSESAPLFEHCRRALERGSTAGPHGLPLIGSHDWNDGLNRVGLEGKGESVWLGWFLCATLQRFADLCERRGDTSLAARYREQAHHLSAALDAHAWDGQWYLRAWYDDGVPIGSAHSPSCQIDAIAQSWAVLSGVADPQRAERAMESVLERLVRNDDGVILLFTPPFDDTQRDPGYIKGYPPGIRENGGQYTHAAIWTVWAFAELGQSNRAVSLYRMLNPISHSDDAEKARRYRVEPYVVAADIYSVPPYVGRGGWTWYTGSAAWMWRLGVEGILGLRRAGDTLRLTPSIPPTWPGYTITYRYGASDYRIEITNLPEDRQRPQGRMQVKEIRLDGQPLPGDAIPLTDDGRPHTVHVILGSG